MTSVSSASTALTALQKVKHLILIRHEEFGDDPITLQFAKDLDAAGIDDQWDALNGDQQDAMNEVREGEVETALKCDWSRHYESKAVAAQYLDGSWVGWTYWYGGGKHGAPEEIDWIDDVYDLTCAEEEKMVTVRTFAKVEAAHG